MSASSALENALCHIQDYTPLITTCLGIADLATIAAEYLIDILAFETALLHASFTMCMAQKRRNGVQGFDPDVLAAYGEWLKHLSSLISECSLQNMLVRKWILKSETSYKSHICEGGDALYAVLAVVSNSDNCQRPSCFWNNNCNCEQPLIFR